MDLPSRQNKKTYGITGINVVMVNLKGGDYAMSNSNTMNPIWTTLNTRDSGEEPSVVENTLTHPNHDYIECLVGYDPSRIFVEPEMSFSQLELLVPAVRDELCSAPTNAPTTQP